MTVDISIDIEGWGLRPGSDARSVGACVIEFGRRIAGTVNEKGERIDGLVREEREFYVALDNPLQGSYSSEHWSQKDLDKLDYQSGDNRRYQLHRRKETVDWWYDQSPEAQSAFDNPVDLKKGLQDLTAWLVSVGVNPQDEFSARIWGHGGSFDLPNIQEWFYACNLPVPWHHRASRDTRTIFDNAGFTNHTNLLKSFRIGTHHNGLDDAITQGLAITFCKSRILVVE